MYWKKLFIGLLIVNILVLMGVLFSVFSPGKSPSIDNKRSDSEGVELTVETNKADLTKLINSYLKKESKDKPLAYTVLLTEKVLLIGKVTVFNKEIDLVMTFEPEALDNGELLLKQESITFGQLELPVSYVLKYISKNYALPNWVQVNSKKQLVYADLPKLKLKSDIIVKVETFNLNKDELRFKLLVPTKK